MRIGKNRGILKYVTPSLIFALLFSFAVACVSGKPTEGETPKNTGEQARETELTLGQAVEYEGLRVSVIDYKFTSSYETNWTEGPHEAPAGAKYLWIYIKAQNVGEDKIDLPFETYFEVMYKDRELPGEVGFGMTIMNEPTYHFDSVYPGYGSEGWLIYEIYEKAEPSDIKIQLSDPRLPSGMEYCWKLKK